MKTKTFTFSDEYKDYYLEIVYSKKNNTASIIVNGEHIWDTKYPIDDRFHYLYCTDYIFPLWLEGKLELGNDIIYRNEFNKTVKRMGVQLKGTKEEFYKNIH